MNRLKEPTLENYVARLEFDSRMLLKHPEHKEMLEKRIMRHKQNIVYEAVKQFGGKI